MTKREIQKEVQLLLENKIGELGYTFADDHSGRITYISEDNKTEIVYTRTGNYVLIDGPDTSDNNDLEDRLNKYLIRVLPLVEVAYS